MRRRASDSSTATSGPEAANRPARQEARVDFPELGRPVIHTAKAGLLLVSIVIVDQCGVKSFRIQHGADECKNPLPESHGIKFQNGERPGRTARGGRSYRYQAFAQVVRRSG